MSGYFEGPTVMAAFPKTVACTQKQRICICRYGLCPKMAAFTQKQRVCFSTPQLPFKTPQILIETIKRFIEVDWGGLGMSHYVGYFGGPSSQGRSFCWNRKLMEDPGVKVYLRVWELTP